VFTPQFAVETQIRHHGLSPEKSMITIESPFSEDNVLTTYDILSVISTHAADTAVLLLPGIQYYTGQFLDIPVITAFAHKHGILVLWDLAHAVGNVPLSLHDWEVDGAAWCSYKYLNGGPGCIGGMFVHSNHTDVTSKLEDPKAEEGYRNRLAGWWGNDKSSRFVMMTKFHPIEGAAGFQLSNPSILDITSLSASLEVFELAGGVAALRKKSLKLTGFLEVLLGEMSEDDKKSFRIITPSDPEQRGYVFPQRLEVIPTRDTAIYDLVQSPPRNVHLGKQTRKTNICFHDDQCPAEFAPVRRSS
jgi:kynureninase